MELTFKNKKGEWVTYPDAEEQIEWLEERERKIIKIIKNAEGHIHNLNLVDRRKLLAEIKKLT